MNKSQSIKRAARWLGTFSIGALTGALLVTVLSLRASRAYLLMTRSSFKWEQEKQLGEAWKQGDFHSALAHAACAHEAEAHSFDSDGGRWTIAFPLWGVVVNQRTRFPVQDNSRLLGLSHAKLGALWRRIGQQRQAARDYDEAKRILGCEEEECDRIALQILSGANSVPR